MWVVTRKRDEHGAGFAEYGLLLAGIAAVVMAAVCGLGRPDRALYAGVFWSPCRPLDAFRQL